MGVESNHVLSKARLAAATALFASSAVPSWTETEARAVAEARLEQALTRFAALDADVDGEVGDADPALAVEDVLLRGETFDAIVLSTLPPGPSRWLRLDLPHRLEGKTGLRVIHVVGHPEPAGADSA